MNLAANFLAASLLRRELLAGPGRGGRESGEAKLPPWRSAHAQFSAAEASRPRGRPLSTVCLALQTPGRQDSGEKAQHRARAAVQRSEVSARETVLENLIRVEDEGAYAAFVSGAPQQHTEDNAASASRRREITRLTSDIIRWKRKLDHIVDTLNLEYHKSKESPTNKRAARKPKAFSSRVRQILRMGTYELYFLKKPGYVVNEYVKLAKASGERRASGLINSLLRKVTLFEEEVRTSEDLMGMERGELVQALGTAYSHPDWIVSRWVDRFGVDQTVDLLRYNNSRPSYCLRTNPCNGLSTEEMKERVRAAGVDFAESEYLEDFIVLERGLQNVMPLVQSRVLSVQDVSAGMVVDLMDPQPGEEILDACAAPGGKFYYTAARMNYHGKLVALDTSRNRMWALERGTRSFPETFQIETRAIELEDWSAENEDVEFDRVLVDAPCSGSGVLAKRADLRWKRSEEQLSELTKVQDRLLAAAKRHVKVGGTLTYSTCSIEEEENEERVREFLSRNANFERTGCVETFPHKHGMDGAFAAKLVRTE